MSSTNAKNGQGLRQLGKDTVNETRVWTVGTGTVDIVIIIDAAAGLR